MLDAYIIDRMRRERERERKDSRIPLRIEVPRERSSEPDERREDDPERDGGSEEVDYRL